VSGAKRAVENIAEGLAQGAMFLRRSARTSDPTPTRHPAGILIVPMISGVPFKGEATVVRRLPIQRRPWLTRKNKAGLKDKSSGGQ
jgi:hypothetical protein